MTPKFQFDIKKIISSLKNLIKFFVHNFGLEGIALLVIIFINFISFFFFKIPWLLKFLGLISNFLLIFFLTNILRTNLTKRFESEKTQKVVLTVFDFLPQALVIYDEYLTILQVNQKFCQLTDLAKEEIVGQKVKPEMLKTVKFKTLAQIFFPSLAGQILKRKSEGSLEIADVFFAEPSETYFQIWTIPLSQDEKKVATKMKIVEDKTAQVLYQKNQNAFYDIAAHQLKTPLSELRWLLESLKGSLAETEKNEIIESSLRILTKTLWLVETILNSVKIESDRLILNVQKINLNKLIEEVIDIFRPEIKINELEVNLKFDKTFEAFGDQAKIFLVLSNLIDNAIRYNQRGGKIEIEMKLLPSYVEIAVTDTGIGIPQREQSQLFERFFRASNVRKIGKEGFGLGLYISKKIIDAHGGKIKIESQEGKGTKVSFTLPLDSSLIPS